MSVQLLRYQARPARYSALSRSDNNKTVQTEKCIFLILIKLLVLCYFRQSVMYRGEVVRTRGGESRPAD